MKLSNRPAKAMFMAFHEILAGLLFSEQYKMFQTPPNLSRRQSKPSKNLGNSYRLNPNNYVRLKNGQIIKIHPDGSQVKRLGKAQIKMQKRLTHSKGYYYQERVGLLKQIN